MRRRDSFEENRELFKDVFCVYCLPFFRERKMRIEKAVRALNPLLQHQTQNYKIAFFFLSLSVCSFKFSGAL